ncbi:MAG: NAD(P)H-hydrate dehydratase [Anaerolineales bacterium]|nr:NAD(P)H-hydrate dehydratase [Anaerolineales bacterium]
MKIFSVAQMAAAEKAADAAGHSYHHMMEIAGHGVAAAIMEKYDVVNKRFIILVGPGNNGGDGLVAGRYLVEAGAKVIFYLFKKRDPEHDINFKKIQEMGIETLIADFDQRSRVLRLRLNGCDFVIDALLGTGVSRPITGELNSLLRQVKAGLDERAQLMGHEAAQAAGRANWPALTHVNPELNTQIEQRPQVVAVDCPSGLNCDTGELDPVALTADLTVTFAGPKFGHFRFPGAAACGEIVITDIGIDPKLPAVNDIMVTLATKQLIHTYLPARPLDGHKGTFGRDLIAAGSYEYRGAPVLSGRAAFRAGAGLVALATPEIVRQTCVDQLPEATYPPIDTAELLDDTAAQYLLDQLDMYKSVLIGPGLGDAEAFLMKFLSTLPHEAPPTVIDADGLNLLAQREDWPHLLRPNTVLTPHPGEMARLCNIPLSQLKEMNRVTLAQEKAAAWGCVLVLKGAYTVVAAPPNRANADSRCVLIPFANPALGTAGSGDVLAGMIVAFLGQGLQPFEAAVVGAYTHAVAGELARQKLGEAGVMASDICEAIPHALTLLK